MNKIPLILQFQNDMDLVILLRFPIFSLLCCKYKCDIYLSELDFNGLCKFNNIYLQDYKGHLVAVSQRRNDHRQVYIIMMEGKDNFFKRHGFNGG